MNSTAFPSFLWKGTWFLALAWTVFAAGVSSPQAQSQLPLDQTLTPDGLQIGLPEFRPKVIALSPDGQTLITTGGAHQLLVIDPVKGVVRQTVALPGQQKDAKADGAPSLFPDPKAEVSFSGLVFSPDGSRLYLSDFNGTIKVFSLDATGRVAGMRSWPLPHADAPHRREEIPAGLAISPNGHRLYVALNLSNGLLELNAETGSVLRRFDVGVAPYDVVLAGEKAYVSNWGGRRPGWGSTVGPAGKGTVVRVDPVRFIAQEGSVSVIDLAAGAVRAEILTGRHASGLALSPDGLFVAVANAGEDTVSVIDTRTDQIAESLSMRWHPGDLFGASPNALTFGRSGETLYVCNGTQNAVAVVSFSPGKSKLDGLIPVGWYPGAIVCDGTRDTLYVANLKGEGEGVRSKKNGGFNTLHAIGSLSLVAIPTALQLKPLTKEVLDDYRQAIMDTALLPARTGQPPRPIPERIGEPSVFKHVIYIIKENRTYDQVLGDLKEGNGDPSLCTFGEDITPNQHELAREFVLLDNTCCAGITSPDGHQWATTAIATDYVEKSFAGFLRSYPNGGGSDGMDALAYSPAGFIWDDAIAHGVTFRNYGEFTSGRVRWVDQKRGGEPGYTDVWRNYREHRGEVSISCTPGIESLMKYSDQKTIGWDLRVSDQIRADRFLKEFQDFEKTGELPSLIILVLMSDHTSGTLQGFPTPGAYVADNDLALGRVVDALSHSSFWKDTCLFAIEDDPQNGWDHVTGYRTTAFVASAYTKRHQTVSERYTQPGMLRTIELMLGLPPMNQLDATAIPYTACFTDAPDFSPFTAVPNRLPLDQMNPKPTAITDPVLRNDAQLSAQLRFDLPDKCPEAVLNQIIWHAQKGPKAPYPQWAVLANPTNTGGDDD